MTLAVADRLIQRRLLTTECKDLSTAACALLNNGFGGVLTFALALTAGQVQSATFDPVQRQRWLEPQVLALLLLSGLIGTAIGIFGIECQRAISATSFSVMQNGSKVAVITAGIVFFADPLGSWISMLGLATSLAGSFMYAWAQQHATASKASQQQAARAQKLAT